MPPVSSRTTMMSTPAQQLRLDRRGVEHRRMRHDGAQIREQSERLAQLQQALFRTHFGVRGPTTWGRRRRPEAPHRRVGTAASVAAGSASPVASMAAPPSSAASNSKGVAEALRDARERAHRLGGDFAADAVAGEHGDQSAAFRSPDLAASPAS